MTEENGSFAVTGANDVISERSPEPEITRTTTAIAETLNAPSKSPSPSRRSYTLFSAGNPDINLYSRRERSPSSHISVRRPPTHTPMFKAVDFDDMVDDALRDRKPAWKQWQESIEDSYHKAKRTVERSRSEMEVNDAAATNSSRRRFKKETSPFSHLDSESLTLRKPSWFASGAMQPRGYTPSMESGPYAAPAVEKSQGIENSFSSRYDRAANDVETRLLKNSILPAHMKTATTREFRQAPAPAPGSYSEALQDETDYAAYLPRPFYSRPTKDDPDYFDYDLGHSVSLYKRPEGRYVPRGPQSWETKLMSEVQAKGSTPVSGYLFTKGDSDFRTNGTSFLSAALRTPSFWERRFESIGKEVRDSNPVSIDSINRNKPVASRFTEYRDPDFEDLSDIED